MSRWVRYLDQHMAVVTILATTIATLVTITAYAFTTFQTKEDSKSANSSVERRLERIEDKIDYLIRGK